MSFAVNSNRIYWLTFLFKGQSYTFTFTLKKTYNSTIINMNLDNYKIGKKLGQGFSAEVYQAESEDGQEFAIKVF